MGDLSHISSVTAVKIANGRSEKDLEVLILRNGLSFEEKVYFNSINEVQWADSNFGRELRLKDFHTDYSAKNVYENKTSYIYVCGERVALNSQSKDFRYCLTLIKKDGDITAQGKLVLEVYEFSKVVHEIETSFEVFMKDRWFVDYFGTWGGAVKSLNADFKLSHIELTFQPVSETDFILRPLDINHTITLGSERFVLYPETRPMGTLEESANPYINFFYISESDGNRRIYFNTHVREEGYMEGSVLFKDQSGPYQSLGRYSLEQI